MRQVNVPNSLDDFVDVDLKGGKPGDSLVMDAKGVWRPHTLTAFGFDYLYDNTFGTDGFFGGMIRFDTATPSACSTVFLGNGNSFAQGDPNGWIQTWDIVAGRVKGYMVLRSWTDTQGWLILRVTGVTDGTTWKEVAVEHLDHQNEPCVASGDRVTMSFFMAGDSA